MATAEVFAKENYATVTCDPKLRRRINTKLREFWRRCSVPARPVLEDVENGCVKITFVNRGDTLAGADILEKLGVDCTLNP